MKPWAVVPVKSLESAKSRLAGVLDSRQRSILVVGMLEHVLGILCGWERLEGVLLVSPDPLIWNIGRAMRAEVLEEKGTSGLNASLDLAVRELERRSAPAVLVVAGDLPGLERPSLAIMLDSLAPPPAVVIATDRHKRGTNALLAAPLGITPFHFGVDSLDLHSRAALAAGAALQVVDLPSLALDIDNPEDLSAFPGRFYL